jgi:hypothetical protein
MKREKRERGKERKKEKRGGERKNKKTWRKIRWKNKSL